MHARRVVLLVSFCVAQSVLAQGRPSVPQELLTGLTAGQQRETLEGLGQARPPRCDNALECLVVATRDARLAATLAREGRTAEQIAVVLDQADRSEAEAEVPPARAQVTVPDWAPSRGPANAPVTIVTWIDFQCPFSKKLAATFKQLEKEFPGKLRFVVRHSPLPFHKGAKELATLSMAAHDNQRFWAFYDAAFDPAIGTPQPDDAWLKGLRLESAALARSRELPRYRDLLRADEEELKRLVPSPGTPTSFVNGVPVKGAMPLDIWREHVGAALAEAGTGKLGK